MKDIKSPKIDRRGSLFGGLMLVEGDNEKILLQSKIKGLKEELLDKTLLNPGAVHNNLANALMSDNNIMEAIKHYKEALALNTKDAAAYMNLGVAYKHMDMFDKALEYFSKR
jgi:tetratricopeptide (TPR) repeat protein